MLLLRPDHGEARSPETVLARSRPIRPRSRVQLLKNHTFGEGIESVESIVGGEHSGVLRGSPDQSPGGIAFRSGFRACTLDRCSRTPCKGPSESLRSSEEYWPFCV